MKLKGRSVPFWAFRYGSKRTLFSVYRITEASSKGIRVDKRVGSLHYGPGRVNNVDENFSYSLFAREFKEINRLHIDYKKNLIISILEKM